MCYGWLSLIVIPQTQQPSYQEGDPFDSPLCSDTHVVKVEEDEIMKEHSTDVSQLHVECPETCNGELIIEF